MPDNPIYINVRRRHYSTRNDAEDVMASKIKEWFYVEDDEYIGVVRENGIDFDYFSRSKLFAPGQGTLTERLDCQINETVFSTEVAVRMPVMTTAERDALTEIHNGQIIYNSTTNTMQGRINGAWTNM